MKSYAVECVCHSYGKILNVFMPNSKRAKERIILIIEEKPRYFAYVESFFKANGFTVKKARSLEEGLLKYQKNRKSYYAVFISNEFYEQTLESIKKLREWEKKQGIFKHQIPIIVAGSDIQGLFRRDFLPLNVTNVYDRPLNQQDSTNIFKKLLRNQISAKQYHALRLYMQDTSYQKAAEILGTKESTYASHLICIQQKFGIKNRAELKDLFIFLEISDAEMD